mmetsp:Transcript_16068/g.22886  ORF Transcript_16068/g.22886 Transcript_16068/m.22886 type:complete len:744 (+) Transcript_16068:152-2383(+)|eukprot:CAMPEP_0184865914 /NCGR_PEP_ID=MMETSP0580-20130426/19692_1 /TAXON_ID=1118495 /ORGANISM="Dactyliosolen fragilissimus" /LENGTH=743 /DNA_ID=CAMNT_0027365305 /DNA_START=122 /DNA_END=2353 /DNA_ORIENTATION=+
MKLTTALTFLCFGSSVHGFSSPRFASPRAFVDKHVPRANELVPLHMSESVSESKEETFEFQAEVGRVMDIIINSLYSDKDIFLRELVSNAADACDKKRFLSVTSDSDEKIIQPEIKVKADEDNQVIIIEDSGVGMTRDELINNLGRIAQSGTKNFVEALGQGKADVNLIGQFGVGFYSAYLVSDKVEVITKSMQPGSKQLKWVSDSGSSFSISDDSSDPIEGSGTRLVLHLKDDALQYLESSKLDQLLQRYSEFIEFPISLWKETTDYEKVPDEEANKELKEGDEPKMKTVPITKQGYEEMNNQKPLWLRPPKEVEEDEYKDFYKSAFRASYDDPQKWTHFVLEGQVECKALLYIPGMLPFELSKDMFDENARNIRLYVKRVFINDKFEDIMPRWLKFVRGVVDSDDLPLNVSREILQKSKVLNIINKRLVRKSLDMFRDLAADEDSSKYVMFWNNFGKYLKVGVIEDSKNKDDIVPLLRFYSSKSGEEYISFDSYVAGMPENQKSIYYVTGDGRKNTMLQPVVEKLTSRGFEVLLMTEPLDEITIESVNKYKDYDIVDATKEGLDLEDDEDAKQKKEELNDKYTNIREYLEVELSGKIQKVSVSTLLTDSPAALVQGAYGVSPTMQKYMKAQAVQAGGDPSMTAGMNQAILEINPNHPIITDLDIMVKDNKDSEETKNFANLIYDVASMTSGYEISDAGEFATRVMSLMTTKAKQDVVQEVEIVNEEKSDNEAEAIEPEVIG